MIIRNANLDDCRKIAELAMMAGEGIPAYFWEQSKRPGEDEYDAGARAAGSETDNFSYRNTVLAVINGETAGMLLAYRLASEIHSADLQEMYRPSSCHLLNWNSACRVVTTSTCWPHIRAFATAASDRN